MQQDAADFIRLRLKNVLADSVRYDVADSVLANVDDPYAVTLRAKAVADFAKQADSVKAVQAFVRTGNIAKQAESAEIDASLFLTDAEKNLYRAYQTAREAVSSCTPKQDFAGAIEALCKMTAPIDAFFDAVMVMDREEKIRNTRLGLMKSIQMLLLEVADFSKLVY